MDELFHIVIHLREDFIDQEWSNCEMGDYEHYQRSEQWMIQRSNFGILIDEKCGVLYVNMFWWLAQKNQTLWTSSNNGS